MSSVKGSEVRVIHIYTLTRLRGEWRGGGLDWKSRSPMAISYGKGKVFKVDVYRISMKERINVTVDDAILNQAREKQFNISEITEDAIREKLKIKTVEITDGARCDTCGIEMEKQTKNDLTKGLCWLWPDEKWCCPGCLRNEIKRAAHILK